MVINQSKYNRRGTKPLKLNIDLNYYNMLCKYVIQNNAYVKMEHLVNLRNLMNIIDISTYENDPEKVKRVNFINKALEARIENNICDRDIILTFINGGLTFQIDFLDYNNLDLTKDDIIQVHEFITETLKYKFIYDGIDEFQNLYTEFKVREYNNRGNVVKQFESLIDDLKNNFRRVKIDDNSVDMKFSLRDGSFESAITNTWNMITNPSRRLITGMQGLNEMTGGGFESGRVYMLLGTSGVGKSITLLNLIYQMKRYNVNYKPKDPTKTPCILLLTMENTVVETITRLFDMVIEGSHGMGNYSVQDVINMLRSEGQLVINESSPIDIVIKYKANKSVDTSYLYTICDDLEDEGYEVICLVQDHVKRIRSIFANSDIRLELGDVVNEFKVFAAQKDIPVITNSHLNRDASRTIEDAARKNNQDVGKLLGKSNIGESMLMIDNLDFAIIITLDYDKDGNKYMAFNSVKKRDKASREYICQPFVRESGIRLVEDYGTIPQFKESIHTAPEMNTGRNSIIKISGASSMMREATIDDVIDMDMDEKDNAFTKPQYVIESPEPQPIPQASIIKPIEFIGIDMRSNLDGLKLQLMNNTVNEPEISNVPICPISFDYDPNEIY